MKTKKLDGTTECVLNGCNKPAEYQLSIGSDIAFCEHHFGNTVAYNMDKLVNNIKRKIEIFVQAWGTDTKHKEELEKKILEEFLNQREKQKMNNEEVFELCKSVLETTRQHINILIIAQKKKWRKRKTDLV